MKWGCNNNLIIRFAEVSQPKSQELEGDKICSPMVGTYYAASSPDAKPFVKVGDQVGAGDTLCLVEAMKMFNKVKAEKAGVIKACLVESGEAVEFNQPLFIVE